MPPSASASSSSTAHSSTSPRSALAVSAASSSRPSPLFIPELFSRIIYFLLCDDHHRASPSRPLSAQHHHYQQHHQHQQQQDQSSPSSRRHPAIVDRDRLFNNSEEHVRYKRQLQLQQHEQQAKKQQRAGFRVDRQEYRKQEQDHPYRPSSIVPGTTGSSEYRAHSLSHSSPSASPSSSSSSSSVFSFHSSPSTSTSTSFYPYSKESTPASTPPSPSPSPSPSASSIKRKSRDNNEILQQTPLHNHQSRHRQSPGTTIVICAQVCKSWSEQLLPLLWHTITMDPLDQPHSLFLSAIVARRRHLSMGPPLEPASFLSTAVFLPPPLPPPYPHPPPYPYPHHQQYPHLNHFPHPHFHPHFHPYHFNSNTTHVRSQTQSSLDIIGRPVASHSLDHTTWAHSSPSSSSHFHTFHPSFPSSFHSFHPPPQAPSYIIPSHPSSSSSFSSCNSLHQQQLPHIATGIPSNGHYIQRLHLTNPSSVRHFDHPSVSNLQELSCVVPSKSASTGSPTLQAAENIMTRNLRHQLQRLEIGGDNSNDGDCFHPQLQQQQQQQQRAGSVERMESDNSYLAAGSYPHLHSSNQYHNNNYINNRTSGPSAFASVGDLTPMVTGVAVDNRSDSSSEGHSSADRMIHSRSRRRRRRSPSSSAATTNNGPPFRHHRHLNNLRHNHQDHPKKKVVLNHHYSYLRHSLINNSNSDYNGKQLPTLAPSHLPSSTSPPYLLSDNNNGSVAQQQQQQQQQQQLHLSSTSSIYNHDQSPSPLSSSTTLPRPRYHSHDGVPSPSTGFFPPSPHPLRQGMILFQQPVHLTQLSLYQYTFILEEWIEMMRKMPSLQHLDLEIVSVVPSASGTAIYSSRSSSSMLLSQSLWNVHPSSPSPPSSSSASSPTLMNRLPYHYRQTTPDAHSITSSSDGSIGTSTTSSDDNDNDNDNEEEVDEELCLEGLAIDEDDAGASDGQVVESGLGHPQQQQQQVPSSVVGGETYSSGGVAATAEFLSGKSDDDDLSLRSPPPPINSSPSPSVSIPRRSKSQFNTNSHVTPSSSTPSPRRQRKRQQQYQQHRFDPRTSPSTSSGTRHPHFHPHTHRQHHTSSKWNQSAIDGPVDESAGRGRYDHPHYHQEEMMTPPALSLMFQFPAVRSLIFRGPCILPGVLEFLPNLDSLSLLPSPSGYGSSRSSSTSVPIKTRTSRSSPPSPSSASLFLEMSQILHDKCLHITKLVLTEPSVMGDSSTVMHLPVLLQTMPGRLVHVELALRGSRGDGYGEREVQMEVVQALVESHGESLQSFVVVPLLAGMEDPVVPPLFAQAHTPLDNVYFEIGVHQPHSRQHGHLQQQQQMQQGLNYFSPSLPQQQQQQQQQQHSLPVSTTPPPHTQTANTLSSKVINSNTLPLLSVLESCPSLLIADCRLPVPLLEVIASFPNWSCHSRLQVLRLELEELSGAGAMDADEEAVMEMFVKSLFIRSRTPVSVPMSEDVDVEDVMETSDVGESSSWSAGPTNDVDEVSSGGSSFPLRHSPASSGSTTSWATSSSSGGLTNALPVRHTPPAPSLLDETGLASASQSPSSSLSSWTTRSGSFGNRAPSTTSTESSPSGASVQYEGQSQRREAQQQRVLGQSFAMTTSPMSLKSVSTASSTSTATTSSVASKAGESMRGSYFPPHTPGTPSSSFSSAYTTSPVSSLSKSTPSSSQSQGQSQSSQDDRRSREAVSAFLSSCSNYQVDAVGRLMALQFLVEYQLASLPRLECFWLGSKMFRIPRRRSSSSSSSS